MAEILLYERPGGVRVTLATHGDGSAAIRTHQDAEPILEHAKRLATDGSNGWTRRRQMRRIGTVPPVLYVHWLTEFCADPRQRNKPGFKRAWMKYLRAKLRDVDHKYLRTI